MPRGPLTTYINQTPPHGSAHFPVGTIIVKESSEADVTQRRVFAMVKRGGQFNVDGARNWEWFGLVNLSPTLELVEWRGEGPPSTVNYGDSLTSCNDCHGGAASNDGVWTAGLSLASF